MRRTIRATIFSTSIFSTLLVILACISAGEANAAPIVSATTTSLGGGLTGFEITIDANDGINTSMFVDDATQGGLGFSITGGIQQTLAFGSIDVDDEINAASFNGIMGSGYDSSLDSYYRAPWVSNLQGMGITGGAPGSSDFRIFAGTGLGSMVEVVPFAYIVSSTDLDYAGTISRGGQDFAVSGTLSASAAPVPEPGAVVQFAAGLAIVSMTLRRTSRARAVVSRVS